MLTYFLALGIIASGGGGGGGPITATGPVIATPARTAVIALLQPSNTSAVGIALGAAIWAQPYDPADHLPYAVDFGVHLGVGEKIAQIVEIEMNATAALLGVEVDVASGYSPIIDSAAGKKIQVWFTVIESAWNDAAFDVDGVQLPVIVRILTDSVPPKRLERTSVLTVRQL